MRHIVCIVILLLTFQAAVAQENTATHSGEKKVAKLFDQGESHFQKKEYRQAEEYLKKALALSEKYMDKQPQVYSIWKEKSCMQLGKLYVLEDKSAKAIQYKKKAIYSIEKKVEKEPELYRLYLANLWDNITDIHWADEDYGKAKNAIVKCIEIRRQMGDEYLLAKTVFRLGVLQKYLGNHGQGINSLSECLTLLANVEKNRLEGYNSFMGTVLFQIGEIQFELNNNELAAPYFLESIALIQAENNPDDISILATALLSLGEIRYDQSEYDFSYKYFSESLVLYKKIAETKPHYLIYVRSSYAGMGKSKMYSDDYETAVQYLTDALTISTQLAAEQPQMYSLHKATDLHIFAKLYQRENDMTLALTYYEKFVDCYKESIPENPVKVLSKLASTLDYLADNYSKQGHEAKAEQCRKEAEQYREQFRKL